MTQTRPNKSIVPINSDAYNLTPDLATMADSLTVSITVASQTERDALPTQTGLNVYRSDIDAVERWTASGWVGSARHAQFTGPAFTTTANTPTNIGTLTADAGNTFNNTFCTGGAGGIITFTKAGIYSVDLLMFPNTAPGASTAFLTTAGVVQAVGSGGATGRFEFGCSASGIYFASGAGFIAQCFTTNGVLIGSRIRITRGQGM